MTSVISGRRAIVPTLLLISCSLATQATDIVVEADQLSLTESDLEVAIDEPSPSSFIYMSGDARACYIGAGRRW